MRAPQVCLAAALLLAACSPAPTHTDATRRAPTGAIIGEGANPPPKIPVIDAPPAPAAAITATASEAGQRVNAAAWSSAGLTADARRDMLIRAEVLLDRAHFSPGVIDGQDGTNLKRAIAAYESAQGVTADGMMDDAVWTRLTGADAAPVLTDYVITAEDVAGPFVPDLPSDYKALSKLKSPGYRTPVELLAEKFHMDEALLTALNPGADFTMAGTSIVVAATASDALSAEATRIEVDKGLRQVRAYAGDKLIAAWPATVGSSERPAPDGQWAVRAVARDPNYNYDPSRLTFGDMKGGKMTIAPGPNNPVGVVWIALTKDTYGIHGAPDPRLVGKTASHGCVRLTNWDVRQLAAVARKGTSVVFVGSEKA